MGKRFSGWLAGALLAAGAARGQDLPPTVEITGTQLFLRDTTLVAPEGYDYPVLSQHQNHLTFQYVGISLAHPNQVRYRHRILRFGEADVTPWSIPVAATSTTFTNISPGTYRFEVQAMSYNGAWSRQPASFAFAIAPPWWRTSAAYALYALLALALSQVGLRVMRRRERERLDRRAERQRIVHLQQLDRAKSDFFTNISHELRTPLTLILGPAELLADDATMPDAIRRQHGEAVRRNARKLLSLTNQLLDLSKLEAGALRLNLKSNPDLTARVRQVVAQFESLAAQQGLTLALDVPTAPVSLVCDAARLDLVLTNLLANALKFTPAGGTVTARVREAPTSDEHPAGAVVLQVIDTGRGIAAHHHVRLFDRFYQVTDEAAPEGRPGTGVGLALVRELVTLHGGTVSVASAPDQGATFTVLLPREPTPGTAPPPAPGAHAAAAALHELPDPADIPRCPSPRRQWKRRPKSLPMRRSRS